MRMTVIHAQLVGDKVLVPREELDRLVALARRAEPVEVELREDDTPTAALMRLAEEGGAFDFWREEGEDIYSLEGRAPL
jgi:hypothetical protein